MSFIGPMGVMVLGFVYVGWRIVGPARSSFPLNVVLGSVLLGLFGVLLAAVYATFNRPSGTVNETLTWSGYL
ncbi:MAG: hypothetical protein GY866_09185, partial [Proteobacteria bacterium]|nr:hypothetical protein [Pseudomonadota bacterium]